MMNTIEELLIPSEDCGTPELSIVIPSLNEEVTIETFIKWCKQGLKDAGIQGEILIVDSSSDRTPQIALSNGARVLRTPKRGLGRAYIDAYSHIRGKYVLLGDCDCTYDFRDIKPFVEEFRKGTEFVIGSRFRGSIQKDAMPPLHQYFGTPVTTWLLNRLYSSKFSDIHCGMRGLTKDAYRRMNLTSQSWEYASEMIIKAVKMNLRIAEVPIHFLKDMDGRQSHHKRMGWRAPWIAGLQNLKAFFLYRPDFFLRKTGYVASVIGALLIFGLAFGPITIGTFKFSTYTQALGLFLLPLGLSFLQLDALATLYLGFDKKRSERLMRQYRYDRFVPYTFGMIALGTGISFFSVYKWIEFGFQIVGIPSTFIAGLALALIGFQLFLKSLTITLFSMKHVPPSED
jgi:glycosyltransferase involved in cell wall biosynthesis